MKNVMFHVEVHAEDFEHNTLRQAIISKHEYSIILRHSCLPIFLPDEES